MTPDIVIKRNDAGKVLTGQFTDGNGAAVDCSSNTSRKIFMKRAGGSTLKIDSTFSFTSAATGVWSYTLQAADVDTAGKYYMELETVLGGSQKLTFPTNHDHPYLVVEVQADLG